MMLGWVLPALAQSPEQRQAMEGEYRTFFLAHRALSTCPHLIEDWEYELVGSRLATIERQLAGGGFINPEVKSQLIWQVEALGCDDPAVIQEAARLRGYAHTYWRLVADAWKYAGGCTPPEAEDMAFLDVLRIKVNQAHTGEGALPPLDMAWLDMAMPEFAKQLGHACGENGGYPQFDFDPDRLQSWAQSPLWDYISLSSPNHTRSRSFDFNLGFTLGVGETAGRDWPRSTYVDARRAPLRADRDVLIRNAACGGEPENPVALRREDPNWTSDGGIPLLFAGRIDCNATLDAEGTAWLSIA